MIQEKSMIDEINQIHKEFDCIHIDTQKLILSKINLEEEILHPDIYNNKDLYISKTRLIKDIEEKTQLYNDVATCIELLDLLRLSSEIEDSISITSLITTTIEKLAQLKTILLLSGKYDTSNALVTIHAGAGGTEACDWTSMLYRMYQMYCQKLDYKIEELDIISGDVEGIKSITFKVTGEYAYGYLKAEKGIHRLVRISPFDSNKRRHTSFSSVEVLPEFTNIDARDVILRDDELDVSTFRSSGAGGQHVNKTESAVRIVHKPTGITVKCQEERSQIQNKEKALQKLKELLLIEREQKQREEVSQLQGKMRKIEWGSQIRSYVFCPYTLVKDHRTSKETSNIEKIMNGDIQEFINEYLMLTSEEKYDR